MSEWVKPGASMEEFSYTKYQCLQESQQREARSSFGGSAGSRYGGVYGGDRDQYGGLYGGQSGLAFGGDSVDHVVTNDNLFRACMNATAGIYSRWATIDKGIIKEQN